MSGEEACKLQIIGKVVYTNKNTAGQMLVGFQQLQIVWHLKR